jgi:hypothetical protein
LRGWKAHPGGLVVVKDANSHGFEGKHRSAYFVGFLKEIHPITLFRLMGVRMTLTDWSVGAAR